MVSKAELLALTGQSETDVPEIMDTKLVVLDIIRQQLSDAEINQLFWQFLDHLSKDDVGGYFYRKRS